MKRKFRRSKNKNDVDVDITSLLDILVILLVFLLKNYNASDLKLDVVNDLVLPESDSKTLGNLNTLVQVDSFENVWINNKIIGQINEANGDTIPFLFEKLDEMKKVELKILAELREKPEGLDKEQMIERKKNNIDKINLVFDKSLNYETIKKVMFTAKTAGFPKFKFIIQSKPLK